ncbi:Arm DNA-binding domain-containing protein [Alkalihalophilus lindianensis]|uniref:Arm DNA-binding domain-containing protein n=1 Tax=Alkalihalophilus lindianensis TaxID=1630542 RepID=A0ABU3X808_9BACI|nr:Arm DNA-binding domain-containing protein [Alkalihalophilus lindianensis]MDV2684009.1 Arm DNA-binding domain-containing protein [Alkalihalophilus lindianensis]
MKGYYVKRGSTWSYRLDIGKDPNTGKRRQKSKSGFRTKKEAQIACHKVMTEVNEGIYQEVSTENFSDYFTRWFNLHYRREVSETTYESRKYTVLKHLLPYFEKKEISSFTTFDIDCFYSEKIDEGYSPQFIRQMHSLLRRSFEQAVK